MHQRSLKVLQSDYLVGGLRLEDILAKCKAYRVKWLITTIHSDFSVKVNQKHCLAYYKFFF